MARRALLVLAACAVAACGPVEPEREASSDAAALADATDARAADVATPDALAPDDAPTARDAATRADASYAREYLYTLAAQAFPDSGHPGVLVHVPPGLDATQPFGAVVYVHGFDNCVANCVEDTGAACTPGGPVRDAYDLIAQFDAAHVRAILVLPETAYDQSSSDPGRLGTAGALYDFLDELLGTDLAPVLGPHRVEDLGRVAIMSHSGGYEMTALMATMGGVPQVREVDLLDSLYGETALFDAFAMDHVARPDAAPDALGAWRFASVYTDDGGTAADNEAMAMRAMGWVADPGLLLIDETYDTLTPAQYAHPLIFKRSELSHDDVPRYYFAQLLAASGFEPGP